MRILVTNDDGILAPGLWALAEALHPLGEVMVVAPDREQSGVGTSVTLIEPIRLSPMPGLIRGMQGYAVEGTPADCVILGLGPLATEPIDLVVSGVNKGANLGDDVLISGTVGAALRAYLRGIPAIAISIASLDPAGYDAATHIAFVVALWMAQNPFPKGFFLNVNLPDLPLEKIEGVEITHMAERSYSDVVEETKDGRGREYFWIGRGKPDLSAEEGSDVWAVRNKRVSITPLHHDLSYPKEATHLQELSDIVLRGTEDG